MAASEYCTAADLHDKGGLPRGALPNPGRLIAAVETATEILSLDEHGFALDAQLLFRAEAGGTLPAPLVAGTTYYAKPLTDSTFQVAVSAGGAAINLTTAGENIVVTVGLPKTAAIQWASALIDDHLIAHGVQLDPPYPVTVSTLCAQLAAGYLLNYTGQSSVTMGSIIEAAMKRLADWAKGVAIRGPVVPGSSNLAITSSVTGADPRGWVPIGYGCGSGEGTIP